MNDPITGVQVGVAARQPQSLDISLKRLWEKIRIAAEIIQSLRKEKLELTERVSVLEREIVTLRSEAVVRDQEVKRLRAERVQLLQSGTNTHFSGEEKEILKSRIRDMIAKINSHLA